MGVTGRTKRVEADLHALGAAVERAGAALACAFQSSADFEAAVIRARRAQGAYDPPLIERLRRALGATTVLAGLALVFLMLTWLR